MMYDDNDEWLSRVICGETKEVRLMGSEPFVECTVAITYNTPYCLTDSTAHITAYMLI